MAVTLILASGITILGNAFYLRINLERSVVSRWVDNTTHKHTRGRCVAAFTSFLHTHTHVTSVNYFSSHLIPSWSWWVVERRSMQWAW